MKTMLSIALILFLGLSVSHAQSLFDRIDNAVSKVDRAANSAERAGSTGGKVLSLIGKKNKNKSSSGKSGVVIQISGGTYNELNTLTGKVKTIQGVENAELNFDSSQSEINVETEEQAGDLLNALIQSGAIKDENITGVSKNVVSVAID